MRNREYIVGVDLGGTNIVSALLNSKCRILTRDKRPTMVCLGVNKVIERVIASVKKVIMARRIKLSQIRSIGVCSPGRLDARRGITIDASNLTGWKNVWLKDILEKKLNLSVIMGHDAAMATLGEKHYGAGIGVDNLVCVTIGTGIGIGIIIEGKLYERTTGDFGHMTIDRSGPRCNCGRYGCLERLVGGHQIAARAIHEIKCGEKTLVNELVHGDLNAIEAKTIFDAARQGDKVALEIVEDVGEILAAGIDNVINLVNPELFIIGGMIAQAGDTLFGPIRKAISKRGYSKKLGKKIVPAKLGNDVGIIGVAHLIMEKLR